MSTTTYDVQDVRVGGPRKIGKGDDRPWSSIHKFPVLDPQLFLTHVALTGDTVTHVERDRMGHPVHGGYDRAVYVFPWELHESRLGGYVGALNLGGRSVGENLRIAGADEENVRVGDVWRWGGALLQVTGPRIPGPTLRTYYGGLEVDRFMTDSGICGWFLRVLEPGLVCVRGKIEFVEHRPDGSMPTIAEALEFQIGQRAN